MIFSDNTLKKLRDDVASYMSKKRYLHTLGVEHMARHLGEMCGIFDVSELSAAALLHDVSKDFSDDEQLSFLSQEGIALTEEEAESPKIWHSYTAPHIIKRDFSHFATENVLLAVYNHTLGAPDMSIFDEIIFLADFIEEGREYPTCISTREYVLENMKKGNYKENVQTLHKASLMEIEATIKSLTSKNKPINKKTILTKESILI